MLIQTSDNIHNIILYLVSYFGVTISLYFGCSTIALVAILRGITILLISNELSTGFLRRWSLIPLPLEVKLSLCPGPPGVATSCSNNIASNSSSAYSSGRDFLRVAETEQFNKIIVLKYFYY